MYFLAVNRIKPEIAPDLVAQVIPKHIGWVAEQIERGVIGQAGKWGEDGGVTILKAADIDEARRLLDRDPILSSGICEVELERFWPDVEFV